MCNASDEELPNPATKRGLQHCNGIHPWLPPPFHFSRQGFLKTDATNIVLWGIQNSHRFTNALIKKEIIFNCIIIKIHFLNYFLHFNYLCKEGVP